MFYAKTFGMYLLRSSQIQCYAFSEVVNVSQNIFFFVLTADENYSKTGVDDNVSPILIILQKSFFQ